MVTLAEIQELLAKDRKKLLEEIKEMIEPLQHQVKILVAKASNASADRGDLLVSVPRPNGCNPDCAYPKCIMALLVAGNEKLPDGSNNDWNQKKSVRLLRQYGEDDGEASDSETKNGNSLTSRVVRLKVARVLGITHAQLNYAQLSL